MKKFIILFALILAGVIGCVAVAYNNGVYLPGTVTTTTEIKQKSTGHGGTSVSASHSVSASDSESGSIDPIELSPVLFSDIDVTFGDGFILFTTAFMYGEIYNPTKHFLVGYRFRDYYGQYDSSYYFSYYSVSDENITERYGANFSGGKIISRAYGTGEGDVLYPYTYDSLSYVTAFVCEYIPGEDFAIDSISGKVTSSDDSFTIVNMYESPALRFWSLYGVE